MSPLAEDKALVDFHRARLAAVPLPQRIYDRMRQQGLGKDFPEFTVVRAAGNNAALVFTRAERPAADQGRARALHLRRLPQGLPEGGEHASPSSSPRSRPGCSASTEPTKDAVAAIRGGEPLLDEVRRIYLNEYASRWDAFIADIRLVPMSGGLTQLIQTARLHFLGRQPAAAADARRCRARRRCSRPTARTSSTRRTDQRDRRARRTFARRSPARSRRARIAGQRIESIVDDRFIGLRRYVTRAGRRRQGADRRHDRPASARCRSC